jgi:CO dehydrogenase/acetyl-CoA synthase delta subunit
MNQVDEILRLLEKAESVEITELRIDCEELELFQI